MPLIATRGAASVQGFGEFAQSGPVNYIEDVFSTFVYPGNWPGTGSTSSVAINPGVDLLTKGGMIWFKNRSTALSNVLFDTARGNDSGLFSNSDAAAVSYLAWSGNRESMTFTNTGATANHTATAAGGGYINYLNTDNFVSWLFRKQPKFFDVVTYTGNGSNRTISHNLGSTPGCIIVKRTDGVTGWPVYHRSIGASQALELQGNFVAFASSSYWNNTAPTSTVFTIGTDNYVNANGGTYVAYLFAHDAGGFGLTGSDNVITCGSFTTDGSGNASINLGYEPQWIMRKGSTILSNWEIYDIMRGITAASASQSANYLLANTDGAEGSSPQISINSTGFAITSGASSQTYIYIAIRRGPMKTPTSGTSVYKSITRNGTNSNATVSSAGFPIDFVLSQATNGGPARNGWFTRLIGATRLLSSNLTNAELSQSNTLTAFLMNGYTAGDDSNSSTINYTNPYVNHFLLRAPGFFDVVCYTGTGSATTQTHNLGVAPEMMIVKMRNLASDWVCYHKDLGNTYTIFPNGNYAKDGPSGVWWNSTTPTSSVFSIGTNSTVNASTYLYVAYLFASVSGVSKVGSYTGTGALQTVNCGFTGGARFVLIKRTDSTGDWYVYDSARGISSGNDPYLLINSVAAEVTGTNYVDTTSVGFQVTAAAPADLNANGGTYIFLAIA